LSPLVVRHHLLLQTSLDLGLHLGVPYGCRFLGLCIGPGTTCRTLRPSLGSLTLALVAWN
jgi:hypothetical protein